MTQLYTIDNFDRELKHLSKKYLSLKADLGYLIQQLQENPTLGTSLGDNAYKIRLAITSKNKGKSGGARIVTYYITQNNELYLLSIYDKSQQSDINDKLLKQLIRLVMDIK